MNAIERNLAEVDKFEGGLTRWLSKHLSVGRRAVHLPNSEEDRKLCKDFGVTINGKEWVVMARMRSLESGGSFYDIDFTLRMGFKGRPDVKTEMDKVFFEGRGDALLYGLGDESYNIIKARLCRVRILRECFTYDSGRGIVLSKTTGKQVGRKKENPAEGDSYFWTFPWLDMPDDFLCKGDAMPRRPDPKILERKQLLEEAPLFA